MVYCFRADAWGTGERPPAREEEAMPRPLAFGVRLKDRGRTLEVRQRSGGNTLYVFRLP